MFLFLMRLLENLKLYIYLAFLFLLSLPSLPSPSLSPFSFFFSFPVTFCSFVFCKYQKLTMAYWIKWWFIRRTFLLVHSKVWEQGQVKSTETRAAQVSRKQELSATVGMMSIRWLLLGHSIFQSQGENLIES